MAKLLEHALAPPSVPGGADKTKHVVRRLTALEDALPQPTFLAGTKVSMSPDQMGVVPYQPSVTYVSPYKGVSADELASLLNPGTEDKDISFELTNKEPGPTHKHTGRCVLELDVVCTVATTVLNAELWGDWELRGKADKTELGKWPAITRWPTHRFGVDRLQQGARALMHSINGVSAEPETHYAIALSNLFTRRFYVQVPTNLLQLIDFSTLEESVFLHWKPTKLTIEDGGVATSVISLARAPRLKFFGTHTIEKFQIEAAEESAGVARKYHATVPVLCSPVNVTLVAATAATIDVRLTNAKGNCHGFLVQLVPASATTQADLASSRFLGYTGTYNILDASGTKKNTDDWTFRSTMEQVSQDSDGVYTFDRPALDAALSPGNLFVIPFFENLTKSWDEGVPERAIPFPDGQHTLRLNLGTDWSGASGNYRVNVWAMMQRTYKTTPSSPGKARLDGPI